ncbi:hypothetical protein D3C79_907690 [compost metagenome]
MHIGDKAGKTAVEGAGKRQVVEDRAGSFSEPLPRHDQGYARRIGHQHDCRDTAEQCLYRHRFHLTAHHMVICPGRAERHFRQATEQPFELLGRGIDAIAVMQLVAQVAQADTVVACRVDCNDARQALA